MISNNINQKMGLEEFNIDEDVKQVLLGSLLGDGSLGINKGGKSAFYREIHSLKQKEYLIWKNQFLKVFDTKLHEYSIYDSRTDRTYHSILLWSKTNTLLTLYFQNLYKQGKKTINEDLLNQVGILGLAIWYMDDGYYHYGDYRCALSTDSYTYGEQLLVKNWLKNKFNVNAQIHKSSSKSVRYNIVLSKNETDKFLRMIQSFIVPSMYYKLGHLKEENSLKIEMHNNKNTQYRKLSYQLNKEYHWKHNKEYYKANKERLLKYREDYYLKNRDSILKQKKGYHAKNREIIKQRLKLYYRNNKGKVKEGNRDYYQGNREKILKREKEYQKKNRDKINKRVRERLLKCPELREKKNKRERERYHKRKLAKVNKNANFR